MAGKFCSTCHSTYRGSGLVHAGTGRHRSAIYRQLKGGDRIGRKHHQTSAALLGYRQAHADSRMVSVTDYYRNPPTPPWPAAIHDRVWYVVHYWRRPPGSVSGGARDDRRSTHRKRRRRRA